MYSSKITDVQQYNYRCTVVKLRSTVVKQQMYSGKTTDVQ